MGEAAVGVTEVWTPCRESRIQLMKLHSQTTPLDLGPQDWDKLADSTEGYSGSDLATLTLGALFQPIRDMQQAVHWRQLAGRLCESGEDVTCWCCNMGVRSTMMMHHHGCILIK